MAAGAPPAYTDWLRARFAGTGGKADLVAYFFRLAYELVRPTDGVFGLVATKTIGQGGHP